MYHLTFIFVGRSFILRNPTSDATAWLDLRSELVNDCLTSAKAVVNLSQTLHDTIGLARSSYTEFTSCSAAVVAMLAQRIFTEEPSLKDSCDKGVKLLREMSIGIFSQSSERLTIDKLEMAARRLDEKNSSVVVAGITYSQYLNWALSENTEHSSSHPWDIRTRGFPKSPNTSMNSNLVNDQNQVLGQQASQMSGDSSFNEFGIGNLASVPGLESLFDFDLQ